jgi:hypothetical protein
MLRLVYALSIGTWLGSAVTLTFLVTPTAHGTFGAPDARRFLRPLFPRYYALGIGCGFAALATVTLGKQSLASEQVYGLSVPAAIALLAAVIGRQVILPRLRKLDGSEERFARLHRIAAMLNTTVLGALVLAMAAAVAR